MITFSVKTAKVEGAVKLHKMNNADSPKLTELEWVQFQDELEGYHHRETVWEKGSRKFKQNPLIPIGCAATVSALFIGLYSMKAGNRQLSQKMMRFRVIAQGLTVAVLVAGVVLGSQGVKTE